ncbi:hypothetical protein [Bosea sp. (in: a-proteobacteria)]|jgi:hypothetical protein|uniref:hypothetical protein n=1 Tax=Bosea sp. (in: a-proteobacteria) TaxID=1871050 RepID=UPI003F720F3F
MANGRPGDHPYTDITTHGENLFGMGIDEMVRQLHATGSPDLRWLVSDIIWNWPLVDYKPVQPERLSSILVAVKRYAEASGTRVG